MTWGLRFCMAALAGAFVCLTAPTHNPAAAAGIEMTPLTKGQVLRGRFEQTRELKGFDAPLKSSGTFVVAPGRGLIWRTTAPFAVATIMSAAGLVQEVNGQEAMRIAADKLPFVTKLYEMLGGALSGDLKALSNVFDIKRSDDVKGWRLTLIPLRTDDVNMPMKAIVIRGQKLVEEVLMTKTNGDADRLVLLDQKLTASELGKEEAALIEKASKP
jgi:Outer membrane lipoprotein carrier protein LolA-like